MTDADGTPPPPPAEEPIMEKDIGVEVTEKPVEIPMVNVVTMPEQQPQPEGAHIHLRTFAIKGYSDMNFKEVQAKAGVNISGYDSQLLEINVPPKQKVMFEPGTFQHCGKDFELGINMYGGCGQGCLRAYCAREPCCFMSIQNDGDKTDVVGLTPNFPAHVLPIDLNDPQKQGFYFKNGALLGFQSEDLRINYEFAGCLRGLCGGLGCCYQNLNGSGYAYLNAGGYCFEKTLAAGEEIIVDEAGIVGWDHDVKFELVTVGDCITCCCGGEGMFFAKFTGPGTIILQTMAFENYKAAINRYAATQKEPGGGNI